MGKERLAIAAGILVFAGCVSGQVSAEGGATSESTSGDGPDSSTETDGDEPLPECAWHPAADEQCAASAEPPALAPEGTEDDYDAPSIAVGPDGTIHVLFSKEHRVGNDFPRALSHFSNASGEWVEQELDLYSVSDDGKIQVSDANLIRVSSWVYLRNAGDGYVRPAPFDSTIFEYSRELTAARSLDLAYLLTSHDENAAWSVHGDEAGCVRRLWTMPACEPAFPFELRIGVAPNGGAPVVVMQRGHGLTLTNFAEPTPEIRPLGSILVDQLGDIEVDVTGQVHVCFLRADLTGLVWAHGSGVDDWQEYTVPGTDIQLGGMRCQLAANADGTDIWLTHGLSQLSVWHKVGDSFEAEDLRPFLPDGLGGDVLDIALGVDGQPVVVGDRGSLDGNEANWFVARRIGDGQWTSEIIAVQVVDAG